jgi:hypothetical protein
MPQIEQNNLSLKMIFLKEKRFTQSYELWAIYYTTVNGGNTGPYHFCTLYKEATGNPEPEVQHAATRPQWER